MQLISEAVVLNDAYLEKIILRQHPSMDLNIKAIELGSMTPKQFTTKLVHVLHYTPHIKRIILSRELTAADCELIKPIFLSENKVAELLLHQVSSSFVNELMSVLENKDCKLRALTLNILSEKAVAALAAKQSSGQQYVLTLMDLDVEATNTLMSVLVQKNCIFRMLTITSSLSSESLQLVNHALFRGSLNIKALSLHYMNSDNLDLLRTGLLFLGVDRELYISNLLPGAASALQGLLTSSISTIRTVTLMGSNDEVVDQIAKIIIQPNCVLDKLYIARLSHAQIDRLAPSLMSDQCCLERLYFGHLDKPARTSLQMRGVVRKFYGDEYSEVYLQYIDQDKNVLITNSTKIEYKIDGLLYAISEEISSESFKLAFNRFVTQEPNNFSTSKEIFKFRKHKLEKYFSLLKILATSKPSEKLNEYTIRLSRFFLAQLYAKCPYTINFDNNSLQFLTPPINIRIEFVLRYYINSLYYIPSIATNRKAALVAFKHNFQILISMSEFFYKSSCTKDVQGFWNIFDTSFKKVLLEKLEDLVSFAKNNSQICYQLNEYLRDNPQNILALCQHDSAKALEVIQKKVSDLKMN